MSEQVMSEQVKSEQVKSEEVERGASIFYTVVGLTAAARRAAVSGQ